MLRGREHGYVFDVLESADSMRLQVGPMSSTSMFNPAFLEQIRPGTPPFRSNVENRADLDFGIAAVEPR